MTFPFDPPVPLVESDDEPDEGKRGRRAGVKPAGAREKNRRRADGARPKGPTEPHDSLPQTSADEAQAAGVVRSGAEPKGQGGEEKKEKSMSSEVSNKNTSSLVKVRAIYEAYPRKVGRSFAMTCIQNASKRLGRFRQGEDGALDWLLLRVKKYAESPLVRRLFSEQVDQRSLIPHCSTWMNQGRYDDDDLEWGYKRSPVDAPANAPKPCLISPSSGEHRLQYLIQEGFDIMHNRFTHMDEAGRRANVEAWAARLRPEDRADPRMSALLNANGLKKQ